MINLVPSDFAPSGTTAKLAGLFKNAGLVLFSIFLISTLSMIGVFIYYAVSLSGLKAKESQLTSSIASLETTEQKLVLIKDRLSYAQTIMNTPNSVSQVDKLNGIMQSAPGAVLGRSEMTSIKNDASFTISDLSALKSLMGAIKSGSFYPIAILDSFNFNQGGGYQVSFTFSDKSQ